MPKRGVKKGSQPTTAEWSKKQAALFDSEDSNDNLKSAKDTSKSKSKKDNKNTNADETRMYGNDNTMDTSQMQEKTLLDVLQELGSQSDSDSRPKQNQQSSSFWYTPDPTMILRGPNTQVKHLDIVDYVNLNAPSTSNHVNVQGTTADILDSIVKAKVGPVRPKLEDVSVEEWNLANVRIMDELFDPPTPEVRNYWAYTARINMLFRRADKTSVLKYDRAYRIKQAEYNCPWGIEMKFLVDEYITETQILKASMAKNQPPTSTKLSAKCLQYNKPQGCLYGSKCKYTHECTECNGKHPKFIHTTSHDTRYTSSPSDARAAAFNLSSQAGVQPNTSRPWRQQQPSHQPAPSAVSGAGGQQ